MIRYVLLFIAIYVFIEIYKYIQNIIIETTKSKCFILVDMKELADDSAIMKRAAMFEENNPNKVIEQYISAHINEQKPIPLGIVKVLNAIRLGFKVVYVTDKQEYLRTEMAKFLNQWYLSGTLYMYDPKFGSYNDYKEAVILNHGHRLIGAIDNCTESQKYYLKHGVEVL